MDELIVFHYVHWVDEHWPSNICDQQTEILGLCGTISTVVLRVCTVGHDLERRPGPGSCLDDLHQTLYSTPSSSIIRR